MEDAVVLISPGGEYQYHPDWKFSQGSFIKFTFQYRRVDYRIMREYGRANFFMNRLGQMTKLRDNYILSELQARVLLLNPGIETVKKYYPEGLQ